MQRRLYRTKNNMKEWVFEKFDMENTKNNITGKVNELTSVIKKGADELPENKGIITQKISDNTKLILKKDIN